MLLSMLPGIQLAVFADSLDGSYAGGIAGNVSGETINNGSNTGEIENDYNGGVVAGGTDTSVPEAGYTYDEATNTYTVFNADGLYAWNEAATADTTINCTLAADIVMPTDGDNASNNWKPFSAYKGTFNGAGFTIQNLRITKPDEQYMAFFKSLYASSVVKDLTLANVKFSCSEHTSGIAAQSYGTIKGCTVSGSIKSSSYGYAAGIVVNQFYSGVIVGCINYATVNAKDDVGGIVVLNHGTIVASANLGTVSRRNSSGQFSMGGITGSNYKNIYGCWTINTGEADASNNIADGKKDGVGTERDIGIVSGNKVFSGVGSVTEANITEMNSAITANNAGCEYRWVYNKGGWPLLCTEEHPNWVDGKCNICGLVCDHNGITLTCTEQGTCQSCGMNDASNHEQEFVYSLNADDSSKHDKTYPCCGAATTDVHTGGTATCVRGEICELCGEEYGEVDSDNHASEYVAEYSWYPEADGSCYVNATLHCGGCDAYIDSSSGYAELTAEVAATDCANPGSKTYTFTCTLNGVEYSNSETFEVKSDNHVGTFADGFCSVCGGYQMPEIDPGEYEDETWDDIYLICNAGQLYWFADYVNNVNNGIAGKLMANINVNPGYTFNADGTYTGGDSPRAWAPIGLGYYPAYCGEFDGNGFVVSGLYCVSEGDFVGMFGYTDYNYPIKNLGVSNSYFKGNQYVGGLIGCAYTILSNCFVDASVTVVGNSYTAGLVGYNGGEINNCYAANGPIADGNWGTITNSYYLSETETEDGGKTAAQFASGEVAYLLQSGIVGEDIYDEETGEWIGTADPELIWGQTIGTDGYPVLKGENVYKLEDCIGNIAYSNTESGDEIQGLEQITATQNSFTISWKPLNGATKYWVYVNGIAYSSTTDIMLTVTNRKAETAYSVAVVALLTDGSLLSVRNANVISAETLAPEATAESTDNSVTLNWNVPGCTKAWIAYGTSADHLVMYDSSTTGTYTMNNLQPGTMYYFRLYYLVDNKVVQSEELIVIRTEDNPEAFALDAQLNGDELVLNWKAYGDSYKYWIMVNGMPYYCTTDTTFTLSGLDFENCTISVRGCNSRGMYDYQTINL
jgi:hypothetical protein